MRLRPLLLAFLLVAAPTPVLAQRPAPPPHAQGVAPRGPVEMLLRRQDALALTTEQVARLEAIGRRMEAQNRPLVSRLVEMRRQLHERFGDPRQLPPEQRAEFRRHAKEARPLLRQIRENNHAAMEEVGAVLTPEQRTRLREMLRQRREEQRDGPRHERRRGRHDGPRF